MGDPNRYWFRQWWFPYQWYPLTWQGWLITLAILAFTLATVGGSIYYRLGLSWVMVAAVVNLAVAFSPFYLIPNRFEYRGLRAGYEDSGDAKDGASMPRIADTLDDPNVPDDVKLKVLENMTRSADDDDKDVY